MTEALGVGSNCMSSLQKLVDGHLQAAGASLAASDLSRAMESAIEALRLHCVQVVGADLKASEHVFGEVARKWPRRGITLTLDRGVLRPQESFVVTKRDATIYLAFINSFIAQTNLETVRSGAAAAILMPTLDVIRYLSPRIPLRAEVVRALLTWARMRLSKKYSAHTNYLPAVQWISETFGEPLTESESIFRRHVQYAMRLKAQAREVGAGKLLPKSIADSMSWPDEQEYARYVAEDRRSRVLTTIHLGNFWYANLRIASRANEARSVITMRQGPKQRHEEHVQGMYSQMGLAHRVSRNAELSPIQMVSALRRGGVTLSAMSDLSSEFGETTEVRFFDRTAHVAKGPAEIAVVGKVPILAFVTYFENGRDHIHMHGLIDTTPLSGERLPDTVQRVTQKLIAIAESWIHRFPHQWQYLPSLRTYFSNL